MAAEVRQASASDVLENRMQKNPNAVTQHGTALESGNGEPQHWEPANAGSLRTKNHNAESF